MIENFSQKCMLGASALGSVPASLPAILMGHYDLELKCLIFNRENDCAMQATEADLVSCEEKLEAIKNRFRNALSFGITQEAERERRQEEYKAAQAQHRANEAFKGMNRPAPEGTVSELAERFGKSISEIRKLKRENRLHELFS